MRRQTQRGDLICGVLLKKSIADLCIDFLLPAQNEAAVPKILLTGNVLQWDRQTTCEQLNSCSAAREHNREVKSSTTLKVGRSKPVNNMTNWLQKLFLSHHSSAFRLGSLWSFPDLREGPVWPWSSPETRHHRSSPSLSGYVFCHVGGAAQSSGQAQQCWQMSCRGEGTLSGGREMSASAPWWTLWELSWNMLKTRRIETGWGFFWPASLLCCFQVWWKGREIFPYVRHQSDWQC